jgi:predicted SAM-dependent methyltransferase
MLSRDKKALFYATFSPLMRMNAALYRTFFAPKNGEVRVHLGPGQEKYLDGWLNVDANIFSGKADVWADLRNTLPFHDSSIDAVYSHHMVEHLPNIEAHFTDVLRCLKPGGVYRVGGPNGDSAILKFLEKDSEWFDDFPDKRFSIGGKLENFIFCRNEHLTLLTFSFLEELMIGAGFCNIEMLLPVKQTKYPDLFSDCLATEFETDFLVPHTLIVEGEKPVS